MNEENLIENEDNENYECTSPEITSLTQLPEISRQKYELVYKRFMEWRAENGVDSFSENIVMAFFAELSRKFKPSTLWSHYSMLKSTLSINNDVNMDTFKRLRAFLKRQSTGYIAKKANALTSKEINKFITEAPDSKYLLIKVVLIIGLTGACKRGELWKLKIDDLEDLGSALLIKIPNTRTKTARKFAVTGNFYAVYKKYAELRPSNAYDRHFFLNYQNGKCTSQTVGINKIGSMAKDVAVYLKLPNPELYTGHCFRKSSATVLVNTGNEHHNELTSSPVTSHLAKSRKIYEFAYKRFFDWARSQNIHNYTEPVLLTYFTKLGQHMKSSSLWAQYSMIKAELNIKHNVNIGIYTKLLAFLKRRGEGYKPKKSRVFTKKQLADFLHNAPNYRYLATKVILIFGITGACRCEELLQLTANDIEDLGKFVLVKIPNSSSCKKPRTFTIEGDFYINLYREYASLRPKDINISRFFIKYQNERCHRVVIGIHKISNVPKEVASYLKLPSPGEYTGHSLRRTSATLLTDGSTLKSHDDWKSTTTTVPEGFLETSLTNNELSGISAEMICSPSDMFANLETTDLNNESSTASSVHTINENSTAVKQETDAGVSEKLEKLQRKVNVTNVKFIKLCRLCASNRDVSSNLTDFNSDNLTILDKLNAVAPNILETNIQLPNGICATCIVNLNHAYTFLTNCVQTQTVYKQYLKQTQNENNMDTSDECKAKDNLMNVETNEDKRERLEMKKRDQNETNFESIYVKCEKESDNEDDDYEYEDNMLEDDDNLQQYDSEFRNKNHTITKAEETDESDELDEEITTHKPTNIVFPECSQMDTHVMESGHFLDNAVHSSVPESGVNKICDKVKNRCVICDRAHMKKTDLIKHMRTHRETHKCLVCDAAYLKKIDLIRHMSTHNEERTYNCSICEKAFPMKAQLLTHIGTHGKQCL